MKQIVAIIISFCWFMVKIMQHGIVPFLLALLTIAGALTLIGLLCRLLLKSKRE